MECESGKFLESEIKCTDVKEITGCISYESTADSTICLKCSNEFFLDSNENTCEERSENSTFTNCLTRNLYDDLCDECVDGMELTSDGIGCLTEVANCLVYEDSTSDDTELVCTQCNNEYYYSVS